MSKRHWNRVGDLESMLLHIEELVVASSGEDPFEEVFRLLVAKLWDERSGKAARFYRRSSEAETYEAICKLLRETENAWPGILGADVFPRLAPEHLQVCVAALARHSIGGMDLQVLDGFFEYLVAKGSKGSKGQYFTPRHIVEFCVRVASPTQEDLVCDPACGSGGFLLHTLNHVRSHEGLAESNLQQYCRKNLWGFDLDGRAVRIAKALMLLAGNGKANIVKLNSLLRPSMGGLFSPAAGRGVSDNNDSLLCVEDVCRTHRRHHTGFDIILTNPPFAGEVRERNILDDYKTSRGKTRVERDVLFIERCIDLLKSGGRLGIVLPHNKFAGSAFNFVRDRLLRDARVLGIVSLGRNTFLPHTHQKTNVMFLAKRISHERTCPDERILFAISEKDGKDSKGRFLFRSDRSLNGGVWESVDHDLDSIVKVFREFLDQESEPTLSKNGVLCNTKSVREIGPKLVLSPERYDPRRQCLAKDGMSISLGLIADLRQVSVNPNRSETDSEYLVLDTSDAREGVIICRKQSVTLENIGSTKKSVTRGCVLISRLRPYLRQVALVDGEIMGWSKEVRLVCSSEFFVLQSVDDRRIGFLVPFLLSAPVQAVLAASQEGGHHPRFDPGTLLDLPIPKSLLERREEDSVQVEDAIATFRRYERITGGLVEQATQRIGKL